jgi:hypothetical protein
MMSRTSTFSYETTQDITIKSGRRALFRVEGIKIRTDDFSRTIGITPGKVRKFY